MRICQIKRSLAGFLALSFFFPAIAGAGGIVFEQKIGRHAGEERFLEYSIEYLNPLGVTLVKASGITYKPFGHLSTHEDTVLPSAYFGSYPLYFSASTLYFRVHIKNIGKRTYKNLQVLARQEFLNTEGGWGEPFPEPNANSWLVDTLGPGQELVLDGSSYTPADAPSGIDQTHLQIIHLNRDKDADAPNGRGEIIIDDAQAGLWCPAPE